MFWKKNIGLTLAVLLLWTTTAFAGNAKKLQPSAENELEGAEVEEEELADGIKITVTTPEMEAIPVTETGEYANEAEPMGFDVQVDTESETFTIKEEAVPSDLSIDSESTTE